jgi:2-keto-myo-inositol isomerase
MKQYTEQLMKIGNEIGCDMIIAVPSFIEKAIVSKEKFFDLTVTRLHQLRVLADNYQFNLGFEPLGFANNSVRDVQLALQLLDAVDVDGLAPSGLVIDTFHYFLGENKLELLSKIPKDRLWLIHIDDCIKKPPHLLQDDDRVWPGEGVFDLKNFISQVKSTGYSDYLSLELFNPSYWTQDPKIITKQAYESLKPFL